jgi:ketosteroid isomerase-like protein
MSRENLEIVRQAYESWSATRSLNLDLLDPEVEWNTANTLDGGAVLHGHEGVREWFRQMERVWEDMWWEIERVHDLDDRVLAITRATARGRGSGVAVEMRIATVWTLKGGKVTKVETYMDPDDALEAVGLSEAG